MHMILPKTPKNRQKVDFLPRENSHFCPFHAHPHTLICIVMRLLVHGIKMTYRVHKHMCPDYTCALGLCMSDSPPLGISLPVSAQTMHRLDRRMAESLLCTCLGAHGFDP